MKRKRPSEQRVLFDEAGAPAIITAVTANKRDPNLCDVRVGDRRVASLRRASVEAIGLKAGLPWNSAVAAATKSAISAERAHRDAMMLLSRRPYSKVELAARLAKRGHDADVVARIVAEAERDGWLDERAYARDIVRGAISRKPAGRKLIEQKLRKRGVAFDAAQAAVREAAKHQDDRQSAYELGRRRLATMGCAAPHTALRRVAGLLARRGFEEDAVEAALERLRPLLESKERDGS